MEPPQARGDEESGQPGLGRVARAVPLRHRARSAQAPTDPIVLRSGRISDRKSLTFFAQRSVNSSPPPTDRGRSERLFQASQEFPARDLLGAQALEMGRRDLAIDQAD